MTWSGFQIGYNMIERPSWIDCHPWSQQGYRHHCYCWKVLGNERLHCLRYEGRYTGTWDNKVTHTGVAGMMVLEERKRAVMVGNKCREITMRCGHWEKCWDIRCCGLIVLIREILRVCNIMSEVSDVTLQYEESFDCYRKSVYKVTGVRCGLFPFLLSLHVP